MMRQKPGKGSCTSMALYHMMIGTPLLHPYISQQLLDDRKQCFMERKRVEEVVRKYAPGIVATPKRIKVPFDHRFLSMIDDSLRGTGFVPETALILLDTPGDYAYHVVAYAAGKLVDSDAPYASTDTQGVYFFEITDDPPPQSIKLKKEIERLYYRFHENFVNKTPTLEHEGGMMRQHPDKNTCLSVSVYHLLIANPIFHPYITQKLIDHRLSCFYRGPSLQQHLNYYAPGVITSGLPIYGKKTLSRYFLNQLDSLMDGQRKFLPNTAFILVKNDHAALVHLMAYSNGKLIDSDSFADTNKVLEFYDRHRFYVSAVFMVRVNGHPRPQSESLKKSIDKLFYELQSNAVRRNPDYQYHEEKK